MPIRLSKGFRPALIAAAMRQQSHNMSTEFLFETPAQQTRLQKAIRQLCRIAIAEGVRGIEIGSASDMHKR